MKTREKVGWTILALMLFLGLFFVIYDSYDSAPPLYEEPPFLEEPLPPVPPEAEKGPPVIP